MDNGSFKFYWTGWRYQQPLFSERELKNEEKVTSYEANAISSFSFNSPELYMLINMSDPPINSPFT